MPAALIGVPLSSLLQRARTMTQSCRIPNAPENPGVSLGALLGAAARAGRDKLTLLLPPQLQAAGLWIEQLIAESTGKRGTGIVPVAGETPDALPGADRVVVAVRVAGDGLDDSVLGRVRGAGVPLMIIDMPEIDALGAEFFRWEVATATAGRLLDINPFDEPNVQQAKDATRGLLDAYTKKGQLPRSAPDLSVNGIEVTFSNAAKDRFGSATATAAGFLDQIAAGDYFALLAYLPPDDPALDPPLRAFRDRVATTRRCATMFGYGPRYLHSTGQLHKGGANNGVFLIITADPGADLPVPDAPYSFGVLEMAQALGDFQSLERANRRAAHIHLRDRSDEQIARLAEMFGVSAAIG